MRPPHAVVVFGITILTCRIAGADLDSLTRFLHSVEAATRVTATVRGDGEFEVRTPETTHRDQAAVIVRPPADVFLALHEAGLKALLLGTVACIVDKQAVTARPFAAAATFADSDFTREDLEPFSLARFKDWRISDESGAELTVTFSPQDSQYSLIVITFDREKKVPLRTLYYREALNNLVKMRRDGAFVLGGHRWMPGTTSMETFKTRTLTTFTLRWTEESGTPPGIFDPSSLPRATVLWPAPADVGPQKKVPGTSGADVPGWVDPH